MKPGASTTADAGIAAAGCSDESQCQKGVEGCIKGACIPCAKLLETCNSCPSGSVAVKSLLGGCVGCECMPSCREHRECPQESACFEGTCTPCALVSPKCPAECPWRYQPETVVHNQCKLCECAPPNQCRSDAECGTGFSCYAGQHCDDGCRDPSCCHGNVCAAKGCKPTDGLSCTQFGCAAGVCRGDPGCGSETCKCDSSTLSWSCAGNCDASCQ
ncbi:MAG TPA: hypothetical protein VJV78_28150 [Polyangiales bacterium]|nr:hypothetical protein [Polyangiales bacterium]